MLRCLGAPSRRRRTKKPRGARFLWCCCMSLSRHLLLPEWSPATPSTVRTSSTILSPPCRRACPWLPAPKIDLGARSHEEPRRGEGNPKSKSASVAISAAYWHTPPRPSSRAHKNRLGKYLRRATSRQPHAGAGPTQSTHGGRIGVEGQGKTAGGQRNRIKTIERDAASHVPNERPP